jgi:cytochrome b involved in lipid metabolism
MGLVIKIHLKNSKWGITNFTRYYGTDHGHHGSNPHFTPYPEELEEPHKVEKPRWKFTREEVAKHCTKEDCWIIIHGKVYDVSEWILFHPGLDKIATVLFIHFFLNY